MKHKVYQCFPYILLTLLLPPRLIEVEKDFKLKWLHKFETLIDNIKDVGLNLKYVPFKKKKNLKYVNCLKLIRTNEREIRKKER